MHRCFGKTDAVIMSLVPMVTTLDLSLKIVVCLVQAGPKLTPSPCLVPAFVCVNSGSGDEANANRTRDLCTGVLMTDG